MNKLFILAVLFSFPVFGGSSFKVDAKESKLGWVGKKVVGQHNGELLLKSGELTFEGDALKGGEFTIDMTSIKVLDLTDPKYNSDLTGHLKSDDFFSADKFPEAKFKLTKVKKLADGTWEAKGPMTIKGISNEITVPLKVDVKDGVLVATGKTVLDRTKWNVKFRSGKFFQDLGDKLIYDNFDIEVSLKAKKS